MPDPKSPQAPVLKAGDNLEGWVLAKSLGVWAEGIETFEVAKDGVKGILRLYRRNLNLKKEILNKLLALSHTELVNSLAFGSHGESFFEVVEATAGEPIAASMPLAEDEAESLVGSVSLALKAAHGAGLLHRNLRPETIYRRKGAPGFLIGDFLWSSILEGDGENPALAGYVAPEVQLGVVGPKRDFYALGVTLWEALTGVRAFQGQKPEDVQKQAIEGKTVDNLLAHEGATKISPRLVSLLRGLLQHRQDKRWGFPQVEAWSGERPRTFAAAKQAPAKTLQIGPESWTQEFFDALAADTKVALRPGQYIGTVVLKSSLHLSSADPEDRAVLVPGESSGNRKGHALVLSGQKPGTIKNLVFQGENNADHILLRIEDGAWIVEDCVFHRAYDHAIVCTGRGTIPEVRRCRVYGGFSGILVDKLAKGLFEANEVFDHVKNNIVVQDPGTDPQFVGNKVHDSRQGGFFISSGASGTYEGNDVFGNILANVIVRDQGTAPHFLNNKVHDGNRGGFYLLEGSAGVFEGNEVYGNTTTNVEVKDYGTTPVFRKNKVFDGKQGGISVYGTASGLFEENEVYGNTLANIFVFQSGTNPEFMGNIVRDGKHTGFSIYGAANGIFEGNKIFRNAQANVFVYQSGTAPSFKGNFVHDGKQGGFFIHGGASGEYDENDIFDNVMANIEVLDPGTNPIFKKNNIRSCLNEGLFIQNGATGRYEGNEFHSNGFSTKGLKDAGPGYPSIRVMDSGSAPTFRGNKVIGFASAAIEISKGAGGVYEGNHLIDLDKANSFVFDKKWDVKLGTSAKRKNNTEN